MAKNKKGGMSAGKVAAVGAGVAALGAAAYYFLGPNGKKNQKAMKGWMMEAKTKIVKNIEKAKQMTEPMYKMMVDEVVAPYMKKNAGNVKEIKAFSDNIKKQWKNVAMMYAKKGAAKKVAKKVAKKAVKKATKKVAKKK
jgi:arginyl-tRNA synthetase